MQVILLESIAKLGKVGDEVRVKNGFGRNFLVPQGKALRATNENRKVFEARRAEIEKENDAKKSEAEKIAKKLEGQFLVITRQAAEDGHLYGSVTSRDVAQGASKLAATQIDAKQVHINKPIKTVGVYSIPVSIHADVDLAVNVSVARTEEEAEELKQAFLNPSKKEEAAEEEQLSKEERKVALEEAKAEEASAETETNEADAE